MTSQRTRERLVQRLVEQGIRDQAVLEVMRTTPRHLFLDEAMAHRAYEDTALPIGYQQTLSQPYIVARMTELLLEDGPCENVLEIGVGSGYQTAVLAQLVTQVYGVERIKALLDRARPRMRQLKLRNVQLRHSDGALGWADKGPFDGILSAAAPERIPQELLQQLAPNGRLVIPVGGQSQHLQVVRRSPEGFVTNIIEPVRFVPLRPGTVR
ncbi:protein-L-isoaspartate(D-aspartate) O-methyltransferase [Parahaliea sp. F7430]|uniref:Protein-L-isoaspartate O-methyltransferase n=2 Tax=Sediminihaliea albiluteola TaxID=2758564 RepID=A0A7W2YIT8_9GAMM|nr:protein-L-isoaspartate(D-aspartate) O-methyltransferase [Sediminihaliea albiluteola]